MNDKSKLPVIGKRYSRIYPSISNAHLNIVIIDKIKEGLVEIENGPQYSINYFLENFEELPDQEPTIKEKCKDYDRNNKPIKTKSKKRPLL